MTAATVIAGLTLVLAVASVVLNHRRLRRGVPSELEAPPMVVEPSPWEREGGRDLSAPPPAAVAALESTDAMPAVAATDQPQSPRTPSRVNSNQRTAPTAAAAPLPLPRGARLRSTGAAAGGPVVLRRDVVAVLDRVPPLSSTVHHLLRDLSYPGLAGKGVASVVASERGVSVALVRAARAIASPDGAPVATGADAVAALGVPSARALILRLKLSQSLRETSGIPLAAAAADGARHERGLWAHAVAVATVAGQLAARAGGADPALAATIGLFHDVGKLVAHRFFPPAGIDVGASAPGEGAGALDRERAAFGGDHAAIGAYVCARWQLPQDLTEGVRRHHLTSDRAVRSLPTPLRRAVLVAHVANQLAKYEHGYADAMEVDALSPVLLAELNLPADPAKLLDEPLRASIGRAVAIAAAGVLPARPLRPRPVDAV